MNRVVLTVLATASLVLAAPLAASAASGADSSMQVSTDGATFGSTVTQPLFAEAGRLVPLESDAASLWVRNPTGDDASVRLSVSSIQTDSIEIAQSLALDAHDSANAATPSMLLAELSRCSIVMTPVPVPAGETVRLDLSLAMLDVDDQVAQHEVARLGFTVAMRDAAAGPFPESACSDPGVFVPVTPGTPIPDVPPSAGPTAAPQGAATHGGLAWTGQSVPQFVLFVSSFGIFAGMLLLLHRRRRRAE